MLAPWKKSYDQPRHHIKQQRHYFASKGLVKAMGKVDSRRRRERQRMRWLDGITDSMDMGLGGLWELVMGQGGLACCSPWGRRARHDWETKLNWIVYQWERKQNLFMTPWLWLKENSHLIIFAMPLLWVVLSLSVFLSLTAHHCNAAHASGVLLLLIL